MRLRVLTLSLLLPAVWAGQETARECKKIDARVLSVTRAAPGAAGPEISVQFVGLDNTAHVELGGPVLGSMDSQDVVVKLSCTATGLAVTLLLERSEFYQGAAGKNALWRPLVALEATLHKPQAALQVKWEMRLSNGRMVERTPAAGGGPAQIYPITLSRILKRGER